MNADNHEPMMAALELLKSKYPHERRVAMWVEFYRNGDYMYPGRPLVEFVAVVGDSGENPEFGHGKTPNEAVESVLKKAGHRDPQILRQQRIAKLRSDIAKLEAESNPVAPNQTEQPQSAQPATV